jgi:hypothetical protein
MQPDRVLGRVARKELQLFFASPVAWLFLASFMVVCLFTFFWVEPSLPATSPTCARCSNGCRCC